MNFSKEIVQSRINRGQRRGRVNYNVTSCTRLLFSSITAVRVNEKVSVHRSAMYIYCNNSVKCFSFLPSVVS